MKKTNWTLIIIILLLIAFLVGYGKNLISKNKDDQQLPCKGYTLQNTKITEVPALGNATSSIVLQVYSDYQCPFCARYYVETIKPIIKEYVDTGKIRLIYHDIAFEGPRSQWAFEAAHCANDQNKFWEYHDKILTLRYQTNNTNVYEKDSLKKIAKELGLNECEFNLCLDSGKYAQLAQIDTQKAFSKITGTPTSFLNDTMITNDKGQNLGAMPYTTLKNKIEELLQNSK